MDVREYHESRLIVTDGPFGGALIRAEGALCPDGVRRIAYASGDGWPDTFFSVPARVSVRVVRMSPTYGLAATDGWRLVRPGENQRFAKRDPRTGAEMVDFGRRTVAGYVTIETLQGFTTVTDDDPATVKFVPYTYRKNGGLFTDDR